MPTNLKRPIKAELLRALKDSSTGAVAVMYDVNVSTVTRWCRFYNIKDRRHLQRKLTTAQVKIIRYTFEQWQKDFGVSRGCLFDVLTHRTYIEI